MLKDRTVLITGASSGIGFAVAQACTAQGASVIVHVQLPEDCVTVHRELPLARIIHGDLCDPTSPARLIQEVIAETGTLDGLVNNAARLDRSNLRTLTAENLDAVMAVNLRAPMLLIQAALPYLEKSSQGSVVNVGSVNALCGAPNLLGYSASKGALQTVTRNLGDALEGRPRVNQVNVGWTLTENEDHIQRSEGQPENWHHGLHPKDAPRGQLLAPEEVAAHIVFWLSELSAPVTGQVYEVEQFPMVGRNRN